MKSIFIALLVLVAFATAPQAHAAAYAATDSFDTYSAGALDGNNGGTGWSGAYLSVFQGSAQVVQSSVVFAGANAVGNTTQNSIVGRAFATSVDSGDMYFAVQSSNTSTFSLITLTQNTFVGTNSIRLGINNGQIYVDQISGGAQSLGAITANTWYVFDLNFLSASTGRFRWSAACAAYSSFTSTFTWGNASPNAVQFESNGGSGSNYVDSIQTTDPCAVTPSTPSLFGFFNSFWW